MKITEKQLMMLFMIARESCESHADFVFGFRQRQTLVDEIISQQSDDLIDVEEMKNNV